jgi:hypothetical protein
MSSFHLPCAWKPKRYIMFCKMPQKTALVGHVPLDYSEGFHL